MSNRDKYIETFEQVKMSEEFFRQVRNMEVSSSKKLALGKCIAVLATIAIVLLSGNGICYAMTGNNIVEVIEEYIKLKEMDAVIQNDGDCAKISSAHTVEFEIDENGNYIYRFMDENGTIATLNGYVKYPERTSKIVYFMDLGGGVRSGTLTFVNELTEENGRIYLNVDGGVDITDDFADGIATGTFYTSIADCENELFKYTVKGTLEDYTVKIEWVEQ